MRPITATFAYVDSVEASSSWRLSIDKSRQKNIDFKTLKHLREEALSSQSPEFSCYKGLSLSYLNRFWKSIRQGTLFAGVELYKLNQEVAGIGTGSTLEKIDELNGKIVLRYAKTGRVVSVHESEATFKRRKMWTLEDLHDHAILPRTARLHSPFSSSVDDSKKGPAFAGWFLACSKSSKFEELLLSLRDFVKESGRTPEEISYFWIDIFNVNRYEIHSATEKAGQEKMYSQYTETLRAAMRCFDSRFLYVCDWHEPEILKEMNSVWLLNEVFEQNLGFEVLPGRLIASKFVKLYDTDDDLLFETIRKLDPSGLKQETVGLSEYLSNQLTNKAEGFESVIQSIYKAFSKWATKEVEQDIKQLPDTNNEADMENFSKFLYKSGNFLRKHDQKSVARSYFNRALENYANLQLHFEDIDKKRGEFDDVTMAEQILMDKVNGGISKIYLYRGLIHLEEEQIEKARKDFKKAESTATKIITQKSLFLYAVSEARVDLYKLINDGKSALQELESMSLQMRDVKTKKGRKQYAEIMFKEAVIFNARDDFAEAKKLVLKGIQILSADFGEKDLSLGKYYVELAKIYFRSKDKENTLVHFEKALDIYQKKMGTINEHVAHIYHKIGHTHASKKDEDSMREALRYLQLSIETYELCKGPHNLYIVELWTAIAFLQRKLSDFDSGEDSCMKALEVLDSERTLRERLKQTLSLDDLKDRDTRRAMIYSTLGQIQEATHQYFKAKKSYRRAFEITRDTLGPEAKQTQKRKARWEKAKTTAEIAMNLKASS